MKETHVQRFQTRGWKRQSSHSLTNVLTLVYFGIVTRSIFRNMIIFLAYISTEEHKNIKEALGDTESIVGMQE